MAFIEENTEKSFSCISLSWYKSRLIIIIIIFLIFFSCFFQFNKVFSPSSFFYTFLVLSPLDFFSLFLLSLEMAGNEDNPPPSQIAPNNPFYLGAHDRPGDFITPVRLKIKQLWCLGTRHFCSSFIPTKIWLPQWNHHHFCTAGNYGWLGSCSLHARIMVNEYHWSRGKIYAL